MQITIDDTDLQLAIKRFPKEVDRAGRKIIHESLLMIENEQIHAYTVTSNPSRRPSYRRTFTLRGASRRRRFSGKQASVKGEWYVDLSAADYGGLVLGTKAQQAAIHRGRWKSTDEVKAIVEPKIQELANVEYGKIVKKM